MFKLNENNLNINEPITVSEIAKVIRTLPIGKSPGPVGLTNDYYKVFQNNLCSTLTSVFSTAVTTASFPHEMLQAYIVTIPKPGKKHTTLTNFRPISLLNTDIKIYTAILALKLLPILPSLINPNQTGFTSSRQVSDTTRRIINILHYSRTHRTTSLLLALDAEKAFNRVHWGIHDPDA